MEGWSLTLQNVDACHILGFKLHNTARSLKRWSQKFVGSIRLPMAMAREVIHKLEQEQDRYPLSVEEDLLHHELKMKCLGLSSLSRTIAL
jgi:hypothetical protein